MATLMDAMPDVRLRSHRGSPADPVQQPGLLASPGSHTTAEYPKTPSLDGPLAPGQAKGGDVEREIQAMLAQTQQQQQHQQAPTLRAQSPAGPRTRHHPCASRSSRDRR